MLRLLVLLLALANAVFFAWQQGMLTPWLGDLDGSSREPQRLAQQVHPERLVLDVEVDADAPASEATPLAAAAQASQASEVMVTEAASMPALPTSPTSVGAMQCFEAGPFSREEETQIQTALTRSLAVGSWKVERFPVPGLWLIYMGPYPDAASMQRKQSELQRIAGVTFEEVRSPVDLRMGFSLGRFNSQAAADAALVALQNKGVRTANVASVRPPMDVSVIRVPQADARMQQLLQALPLPPERGFVGCLAP